MASNPGIIGLITVLLAEAEGERTANHRRLQQLEAEVDKLKEQVEQLSRRGPSPLASTCASGYPPLDAETRTHVETKCAAYHLGRKEQTLRAWASLENGPLRPVRVCGRLAWAVADLQRVIAGER